MTTHYAGLHETETPCGVPCRAPTEDESTIRIVVAHALVWDPRTGRTHPAGDVAWDHVTIDPRHVDCPECVAELPDIPACQCGAPALYGSGSCYTCPTNCPGQPARWCAEHTPPDFRCMGDGCNKPLLDASENYCATCLDPDDGDGDGITVAP